MPFTTGRLSVVYRSSYDARVARLPRLIGRVVFRWALVLGVSAAGISPAVGQPEDEPDLQLDPPQPPPLRPRRIAVLILSGPQVGLPLSDIYSAARRTLERRTALRVLPLDLLGMSDRDAAIRECAGNPACFARRVRGVAAGVDLLLTVSLDQISEKLLLALRLVDIPTEQAIGASAEELPFGMSLVGGMERQLPRVLPGTIWDQVASVEVTSEPSNAEVSVAGFNCATPCTVRRLVPGKYSVTVSKADHESWEGTVSVLARQTTRVRAELEPDDDDGVLSSPYFWTAVGLVAVGAGVLTFLLVQPGDQLINVCISPSRDVCD